MKDVVGEDGCAFDILFGFDANEVAKAVAEEASGEDTGFNEVSAEVVFFKDSEVEGVTHPDRGLDVVLR